MIWNQVMSYGADAMVTVALAGAVGFSASTNAERGNVLLYLLMTMAPFAVVATIIGPALERVKTRPALGDGRRRNGRATPGHGDGDELRQGPVRAVPGRAGLAGAVQGLCGDRGCHRAEAGAERPYPGGGERPVVAVRPGRGDRGRRLGGRGHQGHRVLSVRAVDHRRGLRRHRVLLLPAAEDRRLAAAGGAAGRRGWQKGAIPDVPIIGGRGPAATRPVRPVDGLDPAWFRPRSDHRAAG